MPRYLDEYRDDRHVIRRRDVITGGYDVERHDGTFVGTVYYAVPGGRYRCWRFDRTEPALVSSLTAALAFYRDEA